MSVPVIAFFNNKGGVGKTTMAYHLAWMFADRGLRVVAADLDPQANLTTAMVSDDRMEEVLCRTRTIARRFSVAFSRLSRGRVTSRRQWPSSKP